MLSRRAFCSAAVATGAAIILPSEAEAKKKAKPKKPDVCAVPCAAPGMSYIVLDGKTGIPFNGVSLNEDEEKLIASITKVGTVTGAFDAMKRFGLTDQTILKASFNAASVPWSDFKDFTPGEKHTLGEWMNWTGITSHNGAAVVLAESIGKIIMPTADDPMVVFVRAMNDRAKAQGLTHTQFYNPNGLDDINFSTAREAAEMMRQGVLAFPKEFREYFGKKEYQGIKNHYKVLGQAGIFAAKSGYTTAAGRCGVFAAEQQGELIVGAILNAPRGPDGDVNAVREAQTVWLARKAFKQMGITAQDAPKEKPAAKPQRRRQLKR